MRVGVTGGAGFIGGWVVDELLARGHDPIIFDQRSRRHPVESHLGNIADEADVHSLAARVDGIIHLAAVLGTQETIANPRPAFEVNCRGALNVAEACRLQKIPAVNICVGNYWMRNTYSSTKRFAERLFEQYNNELGTRINNVRVVNAYGPRQGAAPPFASGKVRKIMPAFTCRALSNMPIEVYGDGNQISDCVWVGDVARVLVKALEYADEGNVWDSAVEVGPANHTSVLDVARMVRVSAREHTGDDIVDIEHLPMRPGEVEGDRVVANILTLRWVDEDANKFTPLHIGVPKTVEWFAENEGITWRKP